MIFIERIIFRVSKQITDDYAYQIFEEIVRKSRELLNNTNIISIK